MRFELELVNGGPVSWAPSDLGKPPVAVARKALRLSTDELLDDSRLMTTERMAEEACQVMLVVAAALLDHDAEPALPDFFEALSALVEDARAVMDRGLATDNGATTRCGAVMMELTIRGACASLGLPYDKLMTAVKAGDGALHVLTATESTKESL